MGAGSGFSEHVQVGWCGCMFGMRCIVLRHRGIEHHTSTDPGVIHARSDRFDPSAAVASTDPRVGVGAGEAATNPEIQMVQRTGFGPHKDFAGGRSRIEPVLDDGDVRCDEVLGGDGDGASIMLLMCSADSENAAMPQQQMRVNSMPVASSCPILRIRCRSSPDTLPSRSRNAYRVGVGFDAIGIERIALAATALA